MQVLIRCGERTVALDVAPASTIAEVTASLAGRLGYVDPHRRRLRLLRSGRQLDDDCLVSAVASSGSELHAVGRLCGGGGDGGVYPLTHAEQKWMTPSEMGLSGKAWTHQYADKITEETRRLDRCVMCAASSEQLKSPVVVTDLGYLCNKEAVIEGLLSKSLPPDLAHVKSLKDISDATLHPNPHAKAGADFKAGADVASEDVPYHCPIASIPFNGRHPFVFLRPSGHVISERAFKQFGSSVCPITDTPCAEEEAIVLNGNEEQRQQLAERAATRKAALKEARRSAKAQARSSAAEGGSSSAAAPADDIATATAARAPSKGGRPATNNEPTERAVPTGGKAAAAKPAAGAARRGGGEGAAHSKRSREWEQVVASKAAASDVYKTLFVSKEDREKEVASSNNNFCARGIPMSLSRSTKFTM